jgi:hypothetical protein
LFHVFLDDAVVSNLMAGIRRLQPVMVREGDKLRFRSIFLMRVGPLGLCEIAGYGRTITAAMGPLHRATRAIASMWCGYSTLFLGKSRCSGLDPGRRISVLRGLEPE